MKSVPAAYLLARGRLALLGAEEKRTMTTHQIIALIAVAIIFGAAIALIDSRARAEKRRAELAARNAQDAKDRAHTLNVNTKWSD